MVDKHYIESVLIKQAGIDKGDVEGRIEVPTDSANGDFAYPCFRLSKTLRRSPNDIAKEYAAKLKDTKLDRVEASGGYINFYLVKKSFVADAIKYLDKAAKTDITIGKGKTIVIDYSSINIAKPFHIGHLMSTAIGGSLYKIYRSLGYTVVGVNHLGDYGTQFGKLIVAYQMWGNDEDIKKRGLDSLLEMYVKYHEEADKDSSLDDKARAWFKRIEDGDTEANKIFDWFKEISLIEAKKIYDRLGIVFDSYAGESFYSDKIPAVVDTLKEQNILVRSKGAMTVELDNLDIPPCLILKDDGASLYATRDIACAKYRKETYGFYKNLYVVAYQQALHFKQVFGVLDKMGYEWHKDCIHVQFGMVSLEGGASLSTRKGNVVFLSDVLEASVKKALETINVKNANLNNKEQVAEDVGIGAIVFGMLSNGRIKDVSFSLDKALNFDGETGPYLQYTHARCQSILRKVDPKATTGKVDSKHICDTDTFELLKLLAITNDVLLDVADKYEPSILTRHLIDIAKAFNRFYNSNRIIGESPEVVCARAAVVRHTANHLKQYMSLLLLKAPDEM